MNFAHRICTTLLCSLAILFAAALPARAELLDRVVALVNGEIITLYELQIAATPELLRAGANRSMPEDEATVREVYNRVLNVMISDMLITQEAERLQVQAGQDEIDNELRLMIQRSRLTPAAYEEQLKKQGQTLDMVRERIRKNILANRLTAIMITRKIVLTQDEIRAYYDQNQQLFTTDRSLDIALLQFSSSADADAVLKAINSGEISFEDAVSQHSSGPSRAQGGAIGTLKWSELAPEWKLALTNVEKGGVSQLITLPNGDRAVLKVLDITPGRSLTLEEATPEIEARLREPKLAQRSEEYLQQLRGKAVIEIRL